MKLPEIEIVKPKPWDFVALVILVIGVALAGMNLLGAEEGAGAVSGTVTAVFVLAQVLICLLSFMILGKTAKEGTIWGNLFAVGGGLLGMSGIFLASTMWALA